MKKSVMVRLGCLIVAAAVLSGALIVAAVTGSPYDTLKKSVLDTMMLKNGAVKGEVTVTVDGVPLTTERYDSAFNETASVNRYFDENGAERSFGYRSKNLILSGGVVGTDGTNWYYGYFPDRGASSSINSVFGIGALDEDMRNSASMRFIELAIDALVGDLKNNVAMTERDGLRHVSATLTASQIPELARAALDMTAEQSSGYYSTSRTVSIDLNEGRRIYERVNINNKEKTVTTYEQTFQPMTQEMADSIYSWHGYDSKYGEFYGTFYYPEDMPREYMINSETVIDQYTVAASRSDYNSGNPMDMPLSGISLDYVHGEGDIDANGNLVNVDVNGTVTCTTVFGDSFVIELRCSLRMTDIGSAQVVCPITDAERVLTRDFIRSRLGEETIGFYFKLDANGNVDLSSVTSQYPGEARASVYSSWPAADGVPVPVTVKVTDGADREVIMDIEPEVEPEEVLEIVPEAEPEPMPEDETSGEPEPAEESADEPETPAD